MRWEQDVLVAVYVAIFLIVLIVAWWGIDE